MFKKLSLVGLLAVVAFGFATSAKAATADELQAQITALLAQIAQLQGGSTSSIGCYAFTRDLTLNVSGADVSALQSYLASKGMFSVAPTGFFGPITKAAVASWQTANGVMPAAGYFGAISRAKYAATCGAPVMGDDDDDTTSSNGDLQGGAGSISVNDLSKYSNEEVGEAEEDVKVLAFEVEADDESDVDVTSLKLEFQQTVAGNSDKLDDYAESVSVWFGGEEVGRADAEDFNENSDIYTRTVSLDGAVVRAGETEQFIVAVTGLNNLDSGDINDDNWTVDVLNVRFEDGEGVVTTEDTDADGLEQDFDFASFASAADVNLKISAGDDAINDAHIVNVDDTDSTDEVEILSFNMEAEGNSDILIKDLPVALTISGAGGIDWVTSGLTLFADGEEIGSETAATTTVFTDLDYTIAAGDEIEFVVKADIKALNTALDPGDTLAAAFGETQTDLTTFDAEDEEGEELADADTTGSVSGEAHAFYDTGIMVDLVSVDKTRTFIADSTGEDDQGEYEIVFDVTAFDDDMYIDATTNTVSTAADAAGQGIVFGTTTSAGTPTLSSAVFEASGSESLDQAGGEFWVEDGDTRRFTLTVILSADTTPTPGSSEIYIESINWADATTAEAAGGVIDADFVNYYNFNLDEFKTGSLFLNSIA